MGRVAGVDVITLAKTGAVLTSFIGVVLVSLSDSSNPSNQPPVDPVLTNIVTTPPTRQYLLGDALALFSASLYACYAILLKVRIRSESRIDMQLFFGFVGMFNLMVGWPMGVLLHILGIEPFELPQSDRALAGVLINVCHPLSCLFDAIIK
jgi:solute carrier family 35, member F5